MESSLAGGASRAACAGPVFIGLRVARVVAVEYGDGYTGLLSNPRFSLEQDRGYAEWFGYAKAVFTSSMLLVLYRRSRGPVYLAWSLLLLTVMVDDAFLVHERVGARLVDTLGLSPALGLRA